ncbi:hypothetical protein V7S43_007203 [Phytophthora oleae]|uniref:BHLH domain-containing protein n=1 Tax=Phytophthora oleae TaxID=2107226 RepID=A0ABD3FMU9_9STRA
MYRRFTAEQQENSANDINLRKNFIDNWGISTSGFTGQQEQQYNEQIPASFPDQNLQHGTSGQGSEPVTSPPLSSFSVLLKDGEEYRHSLDFASLRNDYEENDLSRGELDTAMTSLAMQDAVELVSFKLGQRKAATVLATPPEPETVEIIRSEKPPAMNPQLMESHSISSGDDEDMASFSGIPLLNSACSTISQENDYNNGYENDRGFRKKSREKMRRHEVNVKFELLVNVLGLVGRVRKRQILHEATTVIKGLRRECIQLRHDRDRLQQEFNNLAVYLQSSESGSSS